MASAAPFPPNSVLEVADCDHDFDGPTEDLDWSLCVLVKQGGDCASVRMVADSDLIHDIPLYFLRLPRDAARKRNKPSSYNEELPAETCISRAPPSPAASPVHTLQSEPKQPTPKRKRFQQLFDSATRPTRRAPQACGFGSEQGTSEGCHDAEGNFYRLGDTVWVLVEEAADVPAKCRVGKARSGTIYYCPAVIVDISVSSESGSSRVNQTIHLMAYVNDMLLEAYSIDPTGLRGMGPNQADGWYLLPAWCFEVTAASISGFAIARRPGGDTTHPESFVLLGVLITDDDLVAECCCRLETGMSQRQLFEKSIPEEFASQMRKPLVPSYSTLDDDQIYPPVARDALGVHSEIGLLHVGAEQEIGAIAYLARTDDIVCIVTVRHRPPSHLRSMHHSYWHHPPPPPRPPLPSDCTGRDG